MLLVPDLLGYWLSGERAAEATIASTTQLLDVRSGTWSESLMARLRLPRALFPPVVAPGDVVGGLLPHVAEATGLAPSTPLVAVASHDTASAVVAVPFERPGSAAYISSGTWSLVGVELPAPVVSPAALAANLTNERGYGGTIRLLKNVMGLWLAQECRHAWEREGTAVSYAGLTELARGAAPGGPLFDPDLPELLTPGDMPERIRRACRRNGQDPPSGRAELIRSVFESLACKYRLVLEQIEQVRGEPVETVHIIGGGAQNGFLCELTASVLRREVVAGPVEAAALGNLLVQLRAAGELGGLPDMRAIVRASIELVRYEPDGDAERWEALYDRFAGIVRAGELEQERVA
jgi:rhamnulokinase